MDERRYTVKEVADHFRVSTRTIMEWLRIGKIKGSKPGRKWLFTEKQVKAVEERDEGHTQES